MAILLLSLGVVEANALQFGMDQLTEASGEQLSRFVHWYFLQFVNQTAIHELGGVTLRH